jgi:hypothetical protein
MHFAESPAFPRPPTTEHLYAVECYEPGIECLHNKIPEPRFSHKNERHEDPFINGFFYDFNPATVSSHLHHPYLRIYTHRDRGSWRRRLADPQEE